MVRWEIRGTTPPIGQLLLTYSLTNDGPKLTPAVWNGVHFHAPGRVNKSLTGLHFTQWLAVPMPHSGQTYDVDLTPEGWRTDREYPWGKFIAALYDIGGNHPIRKIMYVSSTGKLEFGPGRPAHGLEPMAWLPLPDIPAALGKKSGSEEKSNDQD